MSNTRSAAVLLLAAARQQPRYAYVIRATPASCCPLSTSAFGQPAESFTYVRNVVRQKDIHLPRVCPSSAASCQKAVRPNQSRSIRTSPVRYDAPSRATTRQSRLEPVATAESTKESTAGTSMNDDCEEFARHFRYHMRSVANPVCIVTARRPGITTLEHATVGALVNSFSTVSLSPDMIVSFNLRHESTTYKAIIESKLCSFTFPASDASGMKIATAFTQGNRPPPLTRSDLVSIEPSLTTPSSKVALPPPIIALNVNTDNGLGFGFVCQYQTSLKCGDHALVVAKVLPQLVRTGFGFPDPATPDAEEAFHGRDVTLTYSHGQYNVLRHEK